MPGKTALVASSLSLSATWLATGSHDAVAAEPLTEPKAPDWPKEQVAQEALYQYLNPIHAVAEGNLAVKTDVKPLEYQVKPGDSLFSIAATYGVKVEKIVSINKLKNPSLIRPGQKLKVPVKLKRIRVKEGQTLSDIAEAFQTTVEALKKLNPDVDFSDATYVGQLITIPHSLTVKPRIQPAKSGVKLASAGEGAVDGAYAFHWPVTGSITSGFGWRHGKMHTGIDISNALRERNVIRAALSGVVVRAGYAGAYGNLVVVDHGNGWTTYYAHLSRIIVSKGQSLGTGSALGFMGTTGNSTGVHLHFEIRRNDQPLNPLTILP
jgi:murein DD-endopeptidase MepM/ murein hydrolase activator NlpD